MATQKKAMKGRSSLIPEDADFVSGTEWRKPREGGVPVWLPIGRKLVRLRTVRPRHLLERGDIPDMLSTLVVDMIYGKVGNDEMDHFVEPRTDAAEALAMLNSLRIIAEAAFVYPRIVAEPMADDEIRFDDLEMGDVNYVFRLVFMPTDALSTFRYQPQSDVEPVADGARDAQPA